MNSIGIYIHIPWCIKKCPYCDFNSHALKTEIPEHQYIDALINDLRADLNFLNSQVTVTSIFIGGGTPSLFSPASIEKLLSAISGLLPLHQEVEITLEANPGTFESEKFIDYRKIGINRLSIGIQSFNNRHLKKLGRIHSAEEAKTAIEIAHKAGFDNLNLDLMFGLPDQTTQEMLNDVQTAINHQPSHVSFYQLTLEPNTYFHKFPPKLPKDDLIFQSQILCQQLLSGAGYTQYEVSAYAKNNKISRHNTNYWKFGDYIGIGAGAHGKISSSRPDRIIRTAKPKNPELYLKNSKPKLSYISPDELPLEFLMNQLRLKNGFNVENYQASTGLHISTLEPALSLSVNEGYLIKQENSYYCSDKGWNFLDTLLEKFMH